MAETHFGIGNWAFGIGISAFGILSYANRAREIPPTGGERLVPADSGQII